MGAGNPILAHDNKFNRWVAGPDQYYFSSQHECVQKFDELLEENRDFSHERNASLHQHELMFTWQKVLKDYRILFEKWIAE